MNLPSDIIEAGKAAVQALWEDRVTVMGKKLIRNVMEDAVLYEDIPCHLAQSAQATQIQTETAATTEPVFSLRVDTEIDIPAGCTLIIRHRGQVFEGEAGQAFRRSFSNIVPVKVVKVS